ncbi:hypothetical protein Pint_15552 [Pistacia integerrima]|uniref:Uncharacterized protein n=1 Tax=Pistacia integerrima TaxID=434235 RepID=A0ACC0ZEE7_9ROSI|nr:hypothetical protein Pint_15552 [Pistacia integerrima]
MFVSLVVHPVMWIPCSRVVALLQHHLSPVSFSFFIFSLHPVLHSNHHLPHGINSLCQPFYIPLDHRDLLLHIINSTLHPCIDHAPGIKPASLVKVTDPGVRAFIEKCIAEVSDRLPAKELLGDPFLQPDEENESTGRSLQAKIHHSAGSSSQVKVGGNAHYPPAETSRDFTVQGHRRDNYTIFLKLRIADFTGHFRNIHFPFDIAADTANSVASEMVNELNLTDQDVSTIAAMIESEIRTHIPDWEPREVSGDSISEEVANFDRCSPKTKDDTSPVTNEPIPSFGGLQLERLPSGHKYWSDSPKAVSKNSQGMSVTLNLPYLAVNHEERLTENDERTPNSKRDGHSPNGDASLEQLEVEILSCKNENVEEKEDGGISDLQSEDVKNIVEGLKHLLLKQQKEVDELKRKHELAVSEFLKELSREIRQKVLDECQLKIPEYRLDCETLLH